MFSKERHTIAIIDDHPLFRRGVRELLDLEPGVDVVGEAGTREEAIELVRRTEPDLTILDLNMKGSSGVEILSTLKEEDPSRRIVLTVSDSGKDLTACIQAGADGYFLKDMEPEEFLKSVRRTLEGQTVVDASMLAFLTTTLRAKMSSSEESRPTLTGREAEVLDLTGLHEQGHCTQARHYGGHRQGAREAPAQETRLQKPRRGGRLGRSAEERPLMALRFSTQGPGLKRPQDVCSCGLRASVGQKNDYLVLPIVSAGMLGAWQSVQFQRSPVILPFRR